MDPAQGEPDDIFCDALELGSSAERAAYLDRACGGDADLRRRVERLLEAHAAADSFLTAGPLAAASTTDQVVEAAGTVVGPYKLLEQIGEGGFGVVFMAEQQQPVRRKVALKVLKPGMDTRQVIARFEAERQALALMDHPHIARVFDGGETAGRRPYFVMELVRGVPITDFCDQNRLTIRERLGLFVSVCRAMQHAHQKGIIHRDLKPTNVLVTMHDDKAVAKVIDFGIAKATGQQLTDKTLFTNFAQMIGMPLYMSPEQAQMSGLDVDTRSDIYSLGVLLYELLTGVTPFDKDRLRTAGYDEIRRIIVDEEPAKPSTRISTIGKEATTVSANRRSDPKQLSQLFRGELDWIVMKALEKDRNRRYESASAFAADVERYLHDEPVLAYPPSAWYRLRKLARRHKGVLAMVSVVVAALLLLVVGLATSTLLIWQAKGDVQQALRREQRTAYFQGIALAERELAANRAAHAEELLHFCREDQRGWEWHLLKRQIHEEPLVLTHPGGASGVAFSPTGEVLASSWVDGKVRLWDPATGKLLRTLPEVRPTDPKVPLADPTKVLIALAFSPNGHFLAAAAWDGTMTIWDLAANQQRVLKGQAGGRASAVAFSPDNRHFAWPWLAWANGFYGVGSYGGNGGTLSFNYILGSPLYPHDGVFFQSSSVRLRDITDGTSNTFLFGERSHRDPQYDRLTAAVNDGFGPLSRWGIWGCAIDPDGAAGFLSLSTPVPINYRVPPLSDPGDLSWEWMRLCAYGSGHSGGANFAFADGSVRFVSDSIGLPELQALSTRAGDEVVEVP
jgi:prepilin-type processing-associated H-X9-DG protein